MTHAARYAVYAGDRMIGEATIDHWDQWMGVAGGPFMPSAAYLPQERAAFLDGIDLVKVRGQPRLTLTAADGRQLECGIVAILDESASAGENGRELTAFDVSAAPAMPNCSIRPPTKCVLNLDIIDEDSCER